MKTELDMDKIAKGLGAVRKGRISTGGGYFGALELLGEVEARFRVPPGGGRPTNPDWTERRLVPLAPRTLEQLERISAKMLERDGVVISPMQLAALLLEKTTASLNEEEAGALVRRRSAGSKRRLVNSKRARKTGERVS